MVDIIEIKNDDIILLHHSENRNVDDLEYMESDEDSLYKLILNGV